LLRASSVEKPSSDKKKHDSLQKEKQHQRPKQKRKCALGRGKRTKTHKKKKKQKKKTQKKKKKNTPEERQREFPGRGTAVMLGSGTKLGERSDSSGSETLMQSISFRAKKKNQKIQGGPAWPARKKVLLLFNSNTP